MDLMICPERLRLLIDYRDAAHRYSEAVRDLVEMVGLGLDGDIDLFRGGCSKIWHQTEQARLALARHEANHFCDRWTRDTRKLGPARH